MKIRPIQPYEGVLLFVIIGIVRKSINILNFISMGLVKAMYYKSMIETI